MRGLLIKENIIPQNPLSILWRDDLRASSYDRNSSKDKMNLAETRIRRKTLTPRIPLIEEADSSQIAVESSVFVKM